MIRLDIDENGQRYLGLLGGDDVWPSRGILTTDGVEYVWVSEAFIEMASKALADVGDGDGD